MSPRTIRLFLVDGTPMGLRTAEIGLSTCKAVACPRASLAALRLRPEAERTGVYVLIGEDHPEQPGRTAVYVGEGDEVIRRILRHDGSKDFWDRVIIFVSKDENLTKSHVRHLEAKLVALAREANRAFVANQNEPEGGRLPEAEVAEMAQFLEQILILLGIFGVSEFEPARPRATQSLAAQKSPETAGSGMAAFFLKVGEVEAEGLLDDAGFIVRKGSHARKTPRSANASYKHALRDELILSGVLKDETASFLFTQDYRFTSSSAAATVIAGISMNGRTTWKLADGTTLKDWEDRELSDE